MRLIDCFENWDALVARVPLSQWRMAPASDDLCTSRNCAYCGGAKCTHRDLDQVDDNVVFRKAMTNAVGDPMAVVALKADIERQFRKLPRLPLALLRLMYLDDRLSMDAARQVLRISSLRDVARCHDYWIAQMELALADWFPAVQRRMAA